MASGAAQMDLEGELGVRGFNTGSNAGDSRKLATRSLTSEEWTSYSPILDQPWRRRPDVPSPSLVETDSRKTVIWDFSYPRQCSVSTAGAIRIGKGRLGPIRDVARDWKAIASELRAPPVPRQGLRLAVGVPVQQMMIRSLHLVDEKENAESRAGIHPVARASVVCRKASLYARGD